MFHPRTQETPTMADKVTPDELAEELDAAAIARLDRPAPPELPSDEPAGLEEIDPLGIGAMVDELDQVEETPEGGPTTFAEIQARKRRRTSKVPIVLDVSARWDLINARSELQTAETSLLAGPGDRDREQRVQAALDAVEAAEEALEKVTVVWSLQSISRARLRDLIEACPPTPEQMAQHKAMKAGLGQQANDPLYDPDRFQPALVAACTVEPAITIDDAVRMWDSDEWTEGELDALFNTSWLLNQIPG